MKIAFLGDSITYGLCLDHPEERYATVVCQRLGAEEVNFGIPGTLMARAGMNRADRKSYLDRVETMPPTDMTVIFGGTNDYFWSDTPIGNLSCREDGFYYAVNEIFQRLATMPERGKVLVVTPYAHNGIGNFFGGAHYEDACRHDTSEKNFHGHVLSDYVEVLVELAKKHGLAVLNLHEKVGFDHRVHTVDGCHPNGEGHLWLAKHIEDALKTMC